MMARWKRFCQEDVISSLSGLIPEADHRVEFGPAGEPANLAQSWLCDRVHAFLKRDFGDILASGTTQETMDD